MLENLEARRLFAAITWNPGGSGGAWDHTSFNWTDDTTSLPTQFHDGDIVTFNDTGAGTVAVEAGGVAPSRIFVNATNPYTINGGGINGTSGSILTKSGNGTLVLAGPSANTGFRTALTGGTLELNKTPGVDALPFTGFVTGDVGITGGTLQWDASNQVPNNVVIIAGDNNGNTGTVNLNGNNETFTTLGTSGDPTSVVTTGSGTLNLTNIAIGNGTVTIAAGGAIAVSNTTSVAQNANVTIGGTFSLGAGSSTLFGATSTTVLGGGLLTSDGGLFTAAGPINVQPNGLINVGIGGLSVFNTITLQSDNVTPGQLSLNGNVSAGGASRIITAGAGTLPGRLDMGSTTRTFNVNNSLVVTAQITGSAGLTQTGVMLLGGNNTYTGLTTVNGYVELANPNGLGSTSAGTVVGNNANLDLNGQVVAEDVTFVGNGTLHNESANAIFFGFGNNQQATLTGLLSIAGNVTFSGNNSLNISNAISGAGSVIANIQFPFAVQYNGSAANTYSGKTTVLGGTLILNKPAGVNAIGAAGNPAGDVVISGGFVRWDANNQVVDGAGIEMSGGTLNLNGKTDTIANTLMEISNGSALTTGTNGSLTVTGQSILSQGTLTIAAGGSLSTSGLTSLGDGIGGHTFTTNITGQLNIGAGGGSEFSDFGGTSTTVTVLNGGKINTTTGQLIIRGNKNLVQAGGQINIGTGGLRFDNTSNTITLNAGATPGQLNLAGDITDFAAFGSTIASTGAGLPGVVNFSGNRSIMSASDNIFISAQMNVPAGTTLTINTGNANRLELDRVQTLAGSLAVLGNVDHVGNNLTVNQTLSGTGSIAGSGTTFVNGGIASPGGSGGASVGTLKTTTIVLTPGASYTPQLEATGDQLDVTGTVTLAGSSLSVSGSAPNNTYTIINNDGADPVIGIFNGLPEGAALPPVNGKTFHITYVGGSGNDVVLYSNTPPLAINDSYTVAEDTALNANDANGTVDGPNDNGVLVNDSDAQNDTLSAILVSGPSHGSLTLNANGTFTYSPAADYNGPDSFTYKANDGQADSNVATVNISVTEVNDAPTGVNDSLSSTAEDSGARTIPFATLLANDSKGPANESGQMLTITAVGSAVGGSVLISGTDVIFTPAPDYNGPASFVYTLQDNGTTNGSPDFKTSTATASFTITEVNDAPTANADSAAVAEDSGATTINVTGNDSAGPSNESGQTLTVIAASALHGSVGFSFGNVIYTPAPDYNGSDTITYTIQDNGTTNGSPDPKSDSSTVSVTVTEVNDAPTANPDSATVSEDSGATSINVTGNDSAGPANESGQTLTVTAASALHGSVSFAGGNVIYTPAADYNGPDTITYTIQDNGTTNGPPDPKSDSSTVAVSVGEKNDSPTANPDSATVAEDSGATAINVTANDSAGPANESGQTLTVIAASALHGSVSFSGGNVIYTPTADYNGPDTISYTIQDNGTTNGSPDPQSDSSTVSVTVTEVNDAPTANPDSATVAEDGGATTINVSGNDSAGPANESGQTLTVISASALHGSVSFAGGNVIYTPAADYNGPDTISYTIQDNGTTNGSPDPKSASSTVAVTVTEVNDAPTATADSATVAEDSGATSINVSGNDSAGPANESGQTLTVIAASALHGSVSFSGGNVIYTPAADYNGSDTISYTIQDNGTTNGSPDPKTASSTVAVTVTEVNDAPTANPDSATVAEDSGATSINVSGNDSAGPANESGQTLTVIAASALHGSVSFSGGNVVYTPATDYNGPDTISYTIRDNGTTNGVADPKTSSSTVAVTVTPVNDDPTVARNNASVTVNESQTATNSGTFNDVDTGDNVTLTASEGTVTKSGSNSGTWNWLKPTSDDEAAHTVIITANDGHGGIATTSFTLTVNNVAPTATPNGYATSQATPKSGNVITDNTGNGADSDPAGADDPLAVSTYTQPANGSVVIAPDGSFTYTPATTFVGSDTFTYTISDGDGGFATATVTVFVGSDTAGGAVILPDTCVGGTALVITGTSGNDYIQISPGSGNTISISLNGVSTSYVKPTGRIIVFAGAGDDNVQVAGSIDNPVWLYGEQGNDRLNAGNDGTHGNLLLGGEGNDDLSGGNGRDVMIGGQGADKLIGNANDDILVAGFTTKDMRSDAGHDEFWCDVLDEWSSSNTFQNRVHNLKNDGMSTQAGHNGTSYLNTGTLRDDTSIDQIDMLNGSAGNDWYVFQDGEDKVVGESSLEDQFDTSVLP